MTRSDQSRRQTRRMLLGLVLIVLPYAAGFTGALMEVKTVPIWVGVTSIATAGIMQFAGMLLVLKAATRQ